MKPTLEQENAMMDALEDHTKHGYAIGALGEFFSGGDYFERAMLGAAVDGTEGPITNDTVARFPDDLAEIYGGTEDQYGYIEFENPAGMDRVPFDEAFRLIEIAAKHYIDYRPERREAVEAKLRKGRKTFDRLIARHEAWKKAHPEV